MWKYIYALFTHHPKLYRGTTDRFCHRLTAHGRRIKIFGLAWGPLMLAFHVLDLKNVRQQPKQPKP
jgi:predicted GIY-YIG superfamily endonuclease